MQNILKNDLDNLLNNSFIFKGQHFKCLFKSQGAHLAGEGIEFYLISYKNILKENDLIIFEGERAKVVKIEIYNFLLNFYYCVR